MATKDACGQDGQGRRGNGLGDMGTMVMVVVVVVVVVRVIVMRMQGLTRFIALVVARAAQAPVRAKHCPRRRVEAGRPLGPRPGMMPAGGAVRRRSVCRAIGRFVVEFVFVQVNGGVVQFGIEWVRA